MAEPRKSVFKSKTFWVNTLTAIVGVATYFAGAEVIQDNPTLVSLVATIIGVGNVLLRLVTKQPVSISG